nr:cyclin-dependent kinase-like 2 [Ciona intestinalis]|eukprot:XP_026692918.1 cyclin-dependent kinase-like 2 [Ciona intestinalis]
MEKYDNLGMVGEGSYGMVMKCKHKESGQIVAIKKFLESEDDKMVKKIAMREVRMLRKLHHENLVNLIEVFRRRKRLYLVFEFVDHTVLDDLEKYPNGLNEMTVRKILWQVLRGVEFCHSHNIIHRDIKPENILNSRSGVIKLCDFGFARTLAAPGEVYTDYVATRWYRAPELLVGDTKYGRAVDIWAVGCLITEMLTGDPLFPGDSDIDQLYHIIKCFGNLCPRHREIFQRNPLFAGMRLPDVRDIEPLERRFPKFSSEVLDLMKQCLRLDPNDRPSSSLLLRHEFFKKEGFEEKVIPELRARIMKDNAHNALSRKEALEKREQERRKKKSKEMAAENVDSNLPAAKKHDKNVNSPSKQEISSVKKTSNKPPATTPPVENKKQRKDTEKEKKPLSQTKTDSSKKTTQEEVSSNSQQKTKNSSNSHEKKSSSTKQDLTEAQPG